MLAMSRVTTPERIQRATQITAYGSGPGVQIHCSDSYFEAERMDAFDRERKDRLPHRTSRLGV